MMELLIYKYEPFWQEVCVKSLILGWPVRPVGLLLLKAGNMVENIHLYVLSDASNVSIFDFSF